MKNEEKTLHLPLKKQWYEMIESGVKTEEYREIKPYWIVRLFRHENGCKISKLTAKFLAGNLEILKILIESGKLVFKSFDFAKFSYGYTTRTMTFEINKILLSFGKTEWGAPIDKMVFVISLGKRIN